MQKNETSSLWHVAYTMPRSEKKAFNSLERIGVTSFFPVQCVLRKWSDRTKKLELPLFPNYIFIHTTPQRRFEVINVPEVLRYVCFEGKPAIIPASLLESLRKISGGDLEVLADRFDREGMPVRICDGPFAGVKGFLIKRNGKSKLLVRVESLRSTVSVEIPASAAMPIDVSESPMYI